MVKIQERGRGKFKPAQNYDVNEVRNILLEKIAEEMQLNTNEPDIYDHKDLHYKEDKANIVSLFCGAGGLDLGVELAGIDCVLEEEVTDVALKNKEQFNSIREKGIFIMYILMTF